uniref:hypothetical protein n=1 Tax=Rhodococcus qingshengii TaxID=334542 RepID=UPI00277D16B8|nr:hypothetical protein [Rhodococcus qingshengii]
MAEITEATDLDIATLAQRYLLGSALSSYLDGARASYGKTEIFHMKPEHWASGDLGVSYSGV